LKSAGIGGGQLVEEGGAMGALVGLADLVVKRAARLVAAGIRRIRRSPRPGN
jgi:hypothetical protein